MLTWVGAAFAASFDADVAFIEAADRVDSQHVGSAGVTSETWLAYERLRAAALPEDLRGLLSHRSPVVRVYAMYALAEIEVDLAALLLAVASDRTPVGTLNGCISAPSTVADQAVRALARRIAAADRPRVLAALLEEPAPVGSTCQWLLEDAPLPELAPALVRQWGEGWACALPALARLQRPEDLPTIRAEVERATWAGWMAAGAFPDPSLLPAVRAVPIERAPSWAAYYETLAAFGAGTIDLLVAGVEHDAALVYTFASLHAEDPAFHPLLFALWEERHLIDCGTFEQLRAADPARAERDLAATVFDPDLRVNRMYDERMLDAGCYGRLLEHHLATNGAERRAALVDAVEVTDVHHFEAVAMEAARLRLPEAVGPLIERVLRDLNGNNVLPAFDALIAYGDPAVTAQAVASAARRLRHPHRLMTWAQEALAQRLAAVNGAAVSADR